MAGSMWFARALASVVFGAALTVAVLPTPAVALGAASAGRSATADSDHPVYLALGDSVAAGVGASRPATTGYVPQLHERLRVGLDCGGDGDCDALELRSLAVSGSTTWGLMAQQLPKALVELTTRNRDGRPGNDVRVVTVTIGGNDVFHPVVAACRGRLESSICQRTIDAQLTQVAVNLRVTLRALYLAGGADTTLAVMTYYSPLGSCVLADLDGLATAVLEGGSVGGSGLSVEGGLNELIRAAAEHTGAVTVDTYGLLDTEELVGGRDCLHPNDRGHAVIADSFSKAIAG
jgi:lysophospholipase L1-like esterase